MRLIDLDPIRSQALSYEDRLTQWVQNATGCYENKLTVTKHLEKEDEPSKSVSSASRRESSIRGQRGILKEQRHRIWVRHMEHNIYIGSIMPSAAS